MIKVLFVSFCSSSRTWTQIIFNKHATLWLSCLTALVISARSILFRVHCCLYSFWKKKNFTLYNPPTHTYTTTFLWTAHFNHSRLLNSSNLNEYLRLISYQFSLSCTIKKKKKKLFHMPWIKFCRFKKIVQFLRIT